MLEITPLLAPVISNPIKALRLESRSRWDVLCVTAPSVLVLVIRAACNAKPEQPESFQSDSALVPINYRLEQSWTERTLAFLNEQELQKSDKTQLLTGRNVMMHPGWGGQPLTGDLLSLYTTFQINMQIIFFFDFSK